MHKRVLFALVSTMLFASLAAADSRGGMGRLITSVGKPASCIFPVEVYNIDGRNVTPGRSQHTLTAGEHTVSARAVIDLGICASLKRSTRSGDIDPLTFTVEVGKDYYLGLNIDAPHRRDWKLEIWKVRGGTVEVEN